VSVLANEDKTKLLQRFLYHRLGIDANVAELSDAEEFESFRINAFLQQILHVV
jgi:hypothetical protein